MSKLRIDTMVLGMVSTNTYILYKEGENQAVIVRSGRSAPADSGQMPSAVPDSCSHCADPWPF